MTPGFQDIIAAAEADRRDLFLSTSMRLGTPIQNVEKDFWVCWVLDLLFNGAGDNEPRLLFKGGTSLSKSHGLISRFSEDIDITVFREDLGQAVDVEDLEGLSGKKQRAHLNAIKEACQRYITSTLKTRLTASIASAFERAGLPVNPSAVTLDSDDPDQQTLLIAYPAVSAQPGDYNPPTVKIEADVFGKPGDQAMALREGRAALEQQPGLISTSSVEQQVQRPAHPEVFLYILNGRTQSH